MSMALPLAFDLDLLRSFVIIAEEKSFTRAAEKVGRTQSAVSLQMQKLEGVLGQAVLKRGKGGSVELSPFGQTLLGRAKELLALNDDVMSTLKAAPERGTIRFGIAEELAERFLPPILKSFSEVEPTVEVQVSTVTSCVLAQQLQSGLHDLVAEEIWENPLRWVTSEEHRQHVRNPLPIMVGLQLCPWRPPWLTECVWRGMAKAALERTNRTYQIVATSVTTSGQLAAVTAGVAVTTTLESENLPSGLRLVQLDEGLPALPVIEFLMLRGRDAPARFTDILAEQARLAFKL
jgi:DNA-binding transcriptional LysR family regulator